MTDPKDARIDELEKALQRLIKAAHKEAGIHADENAKPDWDHGREWVAAMSQACDVLAKNKSYL